MQPQHIAHIIRQLQPSFELGTCAVKPVVHSVRVPPHFIESLYRKARDESWPGARIDALQVVKFIGRCEKFVFREPSDPRTRRLGSVTGTAPWVRASPTSLKLPQDSFEQYFFVDPSTGVLYSRVMLKISGGLDAFWYPSYNRVEVKLVTTPVQSDAGADIVFVYPTSATQPLKLDKLSLPNPFWPAARQNMWSPFSLSARDYVRVVGPGVYVGCAYRCDKPGEYNEDNYVYFAIAKKSVTL